MIERFVRPIAERGAKLSEMVILMACLMDEELRNLQRRRGKRREYHAIDAQKREALEHALARRPERHDGRESVLDPCKIVRCVKTKDERRFGLRGPDLVRRDVIELRRTFEGENTSCLPAQHTHLRAAEGNSGRGCRMYARFHRGAMVQTDLHLACARGDGDFARGGREVPPESQWSGPRKRNTPFPIMSLRVEMRGKLRGHPERIDVAGPDRAQHERELHRFLDRAVESAPAREQFGEPAARSCDILSPVSEERRDERLRRSDNQLRAKSPPARGIEPRVREGCKLRIG
jgi:hypothetical protein